jgi:hypothetical protein
MSTAIFLLDIGEPEGSHLEFYFVPLSFSFGGFGEFSSVFEFSEGEVIGVGHFCGVHAWHPNGC